MNPFKINEKVSGSEVYKVGESLGESNFPVMSAAAKKPSNVGQAINVGMGDPTNQPTNANGNPNSTMGNNNVNQGWEPGTTLGADGEVNPPKVEDETIDPKIYDYTEPNTPNYSDSINGDWTQPSPPRTAEPSSKGRSFNPWPTEYWLPIVALVAAAFFIYAIVKSKK